MKISVVIPFRNSGPYLGQALQSVADQTLMPYEVIAIDDGSTDDSVDRIKASGVAVTILQSEARNGAGTRNVGIEHATGDWVAFLDADDYWLDTHLQRAADLLSKGNDVAYLSHNQTLRAGEVRQTPCTFGGPEPEHGLPDGEYMRRYVNQLYYAMSPVLIRRERLAEIGGLEPSQVRRHDIDMWLRAIAGHTWCFDPVATACYREDTPGAISRNIPEREWYFLRALTRNREAYKDHGIDPLIQRVALRVYSAAVTDGDASDLKRADELAWEHVQGRDRLMVRAMRLCPALFRKANRWRRARRFGNADG